MLAEIMALTWTAMFVFWMKSISALALASFLVAVPFLVLGGLLRRLDQ